MLLESMFADFGIEDKDFDLIPEDMLNAFKSRIKAHEQRLSDLRGMFAVAIYHSHILASASAANMGDKFRAQVIANEADPKPLTEKANAYANEVLDEDWQFIEKIRECMKEAVKKAKDVKGGIN